MANLAAPFDSWIIYRKPNSRARVRLFCFPYAGGSALVFRTWSDGVPPEVEVCPIQLPGRGTRLRELPCTRLAPLVQALAHALSPLLDKPFAFFGHSLGAIVSFEFARQLRRQRGVEPAHLFVSAAPAPQLPHRGRILHTLPGPEFRAALRQLNGTPPEVLAHEELMQIVSPIVRAAFSVYETYVYVNDAPLTCPITAFGGIHDPCVRRDDLRAWQIQTRGMFSLHMFPGDHFFVQAAESELCRLIAQKLLMNVNE